MGGHWVALPMAGHLMPLIPLGVSMARMYRNLTPDEKDQTPKSSEEKHAAVAVLAARTLTKERVGSWSDEKLEREIKRKTVCKAYEEQLREMHALAKGTRAMDPITGA